MVRATALVLALVISSSAAFAENEVEEARAAYDAGSSEYDLGHYRDALALFEKAFRLRHVPALLFNIAQCHRMLGELREAGTLYRSFIAKEPDARRVGQARELLAQVEEAVAKQSQAQSAPPTDASPQREAQPLPEPQKPADPKAANARLADPGLAERPPQPKIAEQKPRAPSSPEPIPARAVAAAQPARAVEAPRAAPNAAVEGRPSAGPKQQRVFTWVAAAASATAFGVGAAFGARSSSTKSSLTSSQHTSADVVNLRDSFVNDAHRANALFIAGGVLAGLTAGLFILEF